MPEITVSEKAYARLVEFKSVFDNVTEENIGFAAYVESILTVGVDSILGSLMESLDQKALLSVCLGSTSRSCLEGIRQTISGLSRPRMWAA